MHEVDRGLCLGQGLPHLCVPANPLLERLEGRSFPSKDAPAKVVLVVDLVEYISLEGSPADGALDHFRLHHWVLLDVELGLGKDIGLVFGLDSR